MKGAARLEVAAGRTRRRMDSDRRCPREWSRLSSTGGGELIHDGPLGHICPLAMESWAATIGTELSNSRDSRPSTTGRTFLRRAGREGSDIVSSPCLDDIENGHEFDEDAHPDEIPKRFGERWQGRCGQSPDIEEARNPGPVTIFPSAGQLVRQDGVRRPLLPDGAVPAGRWPRPPTGERLQFFSALPFLSARRVKKGLQIVGDLSDLLDRPTDRFGRPIQVQDQATPQAVGGLQAIRPLGDHPHFC